MDQGEGQCLSNAELPLTAGKYVQGFFMRRKRL